MGGTVRGLMDVLDAGLDMSRSARMKRAEELGYDTSRVWYHGTDKDFDAFNPEKYLAEGGAAFFTSDKTLASQYALKNGRGGHVIPVYLKRGAVRSGYRTPTPEEFAAMSSDEISQMVRDIDKWNDQLNKRAYVQNEIENAGGKNVIFENLEDPITYDQFRLAVSDVAAVTNPDDIRSIYAAFDPKNSGSNKISGNASPELLGTIAGTGILAALAGKVGQGINFATDSMEMPTRGLHGLAQTVGTLATGGGWENAIRNGAQYARQPLDVTARNVGEYTADRTGSPYAASLMDALTRMASLEP